MALHLVTGFKGSAHITSADQGAFNAGVVGTGEYVMKTGNQLSAQIVSNNQIRILDGDIVMQGRHINLKKDTHEDVAIANGLSGLNRNDLIVLRYTKDANTGVESIALAVLQGVSTESTANDPSFTKGDVLSGECLLNEMPLFRVQLSGLNINKVVPLFTVVESMDDHGKKLNEQEAEMTEHIDDVSNPHNVTKAQVGLENVPNVATNDQTPTYTQASSNTALASGEKLSVAFGKIAKAISSLIAHLANVSNPHSVTKAQVGLGNCDNTSDANKPVSTAMQTALNGKANSSHQQSASTITDGVLAGAVTAKASAVSALNLKQVRNIYAGTDEMTSGTSALASGDIYIQYE